VPYITLCLADAPGVFVAASDYLKSLPAMVSRWFPRPPALLGTDGFGRSESRAGLRDFFEVDAKHIAFATLVELLREKKIEASVVKKAMQELPINPEKPNPANS
jgi:pyruvate dehydrogenase E1 component